MTTTIMAEPDTGDRHRGGLPPTVRVTTWVDGLAARVGHDPRSEYAERFWLPVIGPTSLFLLRRMAARLDARPEGFDQDTAELAAELGVGPSRAANSPLARTLGRLDGFRCARWVDDGRIAFRRHLYPLTASQARRLPASLAAELGTER